LIDKQSHLKEQDLRLVNAEEELKKIEEGKKSLE